MENVTESKKNPIFKRFDQNIYRAFTSTALDVS